LNPWFYYIPLLIAMVVLILGFFLLEGYVRKLRSVGISSVIAFGLFFIPVSIRCVPAFLEIAGIKMVGYIINMLVHLPTVVVFKILNLEHIAIRSYQLEMLIEVGNFIINVFAIYGIIRLISHTKQRASAKKLCL
jgi:hypothetical protein